MGLFDKPPIKEYVTKVTSDILKHDGVGHDRLMAEGRPGESGRYKYGSGENPYQHQPHALLDFDNEMKKMGLSEKERAALWSKRTLGEKIPPYKVTQYRDMISIAKTRTRQNLYDKVAYLRYQKNMGPSEIARELGLPNESSVRSILDKESKLRMNKADATANMLKDRMDEVGGQYLEVGKGVEHELGLTRTSLNKSLMMLRMEGYEVYSRRVEQPTNPGQFTTITLLCPPGTEYKDIYKSDALSKINSVIDYTNGKEIKIKTQAFQYPESLDSSRLMIRYDEDGGTVKDGLIEIRPGVADLSLGNDRYAQVRIAVDDKYYLKGMAVYSENIPKGYDIVFNTNKSSDVGMYKTLKPLHTTSDGKIDKSNPFGSLIKTGDDATTLGEGGGQSYYIDPITGKQKLSLINKTRGEGDWMKWKDQIPSQFLAKQPQKLIDQQLNLTLKDKKAQYDEIMSVTNPTVRKQLLLNFADECDASAVDLNAMALPGQKWHVIIPLSSMPDNEVYAPQYKNGETVALVRYPHGGTFEIPILTVNNKRKEGQKVITNKSTDAVGINAAVAHQLSGADFDGDTVMLIPCNSSTSKIKIHSRKGLDQLEGFEPSVLYGPDPINGERKGSDGITHYFRNGKEYKVLKDGSAKEKEMGVISNLIMDMTLKGDASDDELARAVRHSMVVIDAPKHKLDYKQSEIDNGITELKKKYQIKEVLDDGAVKYGGASTLITRAKSEASMPKTQGSYHIDEYWDVTANNGRGSWVSTGKNEGKKYYKPSDNLYYPDGSLDRDTGIRTLVTTEGKKVSYDVRNNTEAKKYAPIERKDPKTGKVTYTNPDGTIKYKTNMKTTKTTKMATTDDAMSLLSMERTPQELAYGKYANNLKALANQARKEYVNTPEITYSPSARKTYHEEYDSLTSKLKMSQKNAPKERMATIIANQEVNAKVEQARLSGEKLSAKEKGKLSQIAMTEARLQVGAGRNPVNITPKEWEAIQAGAIGSSTLKQILLKAEEGQVRDYAIPKTDKGLTPGQIARINNLYNSNVDYTIQQISSIVGVSASTVEKYLDKP